MPIASSNFSGIENPLSEGGLWITPFASMTPQGVVMTKSGVAQASAAIGPGTNHAGARTTAAVPNDHYSEIVVGNVIAGSKVGPVVRYQLSGPTHDSHYLWWVSPQTDINNNLYRIDANGTTYTPAAILGVSGVVAGDRLRLIARGPVLYGYKNGVREFIYHTGQDGIRYLTGTTGILEFPNVGSGVGAATIASWSTDAAPASVGDWDSSKFAGTAESPLNENDGWYPIPGTQPNAGIAKSGGLARGMVVGIHNLEGNWRITPPNDQYAQVTLGDVTSGGGGPMVRMTRTALIQNGYLLFIFIDTPGSSGYLPDRARSQFIHVSDCCSYDPSPRSWRRLEAHRDWQHADGVQEWRPSRANDRRHLRQRRRWDRRVRQRVRVFCVGRWEPRRPSTDQGPKHIYCRQGRR